MTKTLKRPLVTGFMLFAFIIPLHAQNEAAPGKLFVDAAGNPQGIASSAGSDQRGITLPGRDAEISIGGSRSNQIWLWPPGSVLPVVFDPARGEITVTSQPEIAKPGVWSTSGPNAILGSGNVGIGNSKPGYNLDVLGTFNVQDANGSYIRSSSDENMWLKIKSSRGGVNLTVQGNGGHQWNLSGGEAHGWEGGFQIYDQTALESRFAVDTSGNVSIGASTIRWDGRSYNPNTPPLYVASSGSVGIGTVSPQAPLDITSTSNDKFAIRFLPYAHNNYNVLQFFDGDGSEHGEVTSNYHDRVLKMENARSGWGIYEWDNGSMAYTIDEHYRNISEQPFYIDAGGSINIGGNGGALAVRGPLLLSGTSSSPNRITNGGLVVTGSAVNNSSSTIIVSTGTNLVLIPQQGDLSMGDFTAGAQPK